MVMATAQKHISDIGIDNLHTGYFIEVKPKDMRNSKSYFSNQQPKFACIKNRFDIDIYFRNTLYNQSYIDLPTNKITVRVNNYDTMVLCNKILEQDLDYSLNHKNFDALTEQSSDLTLIHKILQILNNDQAVYYVGFRL